MKLALKLMAAGTLALLFAAPAAAAVDAEIDKARQMVPHGRYVPGFDHLIPPDARWENFRYACEQTKRICYSHA